MENPLESPWKLLFGGISSSEINESSEHKTIRMSSALISSPFIDSYPLPSLSLQMSLLGIASFLTFLINSTGILLNVLLIVVIQIFSKRTMGFYKWLMTCYSLYELLYASVVLLVMPVHFVFERSWIAFSYHGPLSQTSLATYSTSFYCVLYAAWLGLVAVNFIYRYINLCRVKFAIKISKSLWMKCSFLAVYLTFVAATSFCAFYVCIQSHPNENFLDGLNRGYGLDTTEHLNYIMVRVHDPFTGVVSIPAVLGILAHLVFLVCWLAAIFFCGSRIFQKIKNIQRNQSFINLTLEKQLFTVLVLQTVIPLLFAGIPTLLHFSFPLWEHEAFFSSFSPFYSAVSSLPKVLDPIVAILFIKNYREGIRKFLGIRPSSVSASSSGASATKTQSTEAARRYSSQEPQN